MIHKNRVLSKCTTCQNCTNISLCVSGRMMSHIVGKTDDEIYLNGCYAYQKDVPAQFADTDIWKALYKGK